MGRLPGLLLAASGLLLAQPQPKTILFTRLGPSQTGLFVSNADGTAERPLLNSESLDYNPAWSPDGQWIVFTSERNGSADLYRVKPDGTGLQRITDHPAYDDQADVSPDGQKLVICQHPCRRHHRFMGSRSEHESRDTAHVWAWRRFPAVVVSRRQVDRVFL